MGAIYLIESLSVESVRLSCVLTVIARAVFAARSDSSISAFGWKDDVFYSYDAEGSQGVIIFDAWKRFVALIVRRDTPRNPYRTGINEWRQYLRGAPPGLVEIVNRRAPAFIKGETAEWLDEPVATAAFWGVQGGIFAVEARDSLFLHGGSLFEEQLCPPEIAMQRWSDYYEFSEGATTAMRAIYLRRTEAPLADRVLLTADEMAVIFGQPSSPDPETALEYFASVGVFPPLV